MEVAKTGKPLKAWTGARPARESEFRGRYCSLSTRRDAIHRDDFPSAFADEKMSELWTYMV